MRVMVMVKASKSSEAGAMPSEELLTAMGNFNEELVKAGIMLSGDGLRPNPFFGCGTDGDRRSVCGDERTGRGLLGLEGEVDGRSD